MTTQFSISASRATLAVSSFSCTNLVGASGTGLKFKTHGVASQLRLFVVICALLLSVLLAHTSPAQQINYNSFNAPQASSSSPFSVSCPAGTNILFCINYTGTAPGFVTDFYPPVIDPNAATDGGAGSSNYALQLTPNLSSQDASVWFATPQDVVDGFTTWYTVKINYQGGGDGNTADGLAFVIQSAIGGKTDSIANCPETGSGPTALGNGGGCLGYGGIDNSVALEMDTFYSSWDPQQGSRGTSFSDNHLALQSCGLDGNGNPISNSPTHTTSPNCLIILNNGVSTLITSPVTSVPAGAASTAVLLSDGNPHQVVMIYNGPNDSPANYLWVYLDATYNPGTHTPVAGSVPLFSGPFDITQYMKLATGGGAYGPAYVGFTAATGGDYEQHELMGWTFTPHANQPNFGNVTVCPAGQTTPAPCNETLAYTYKFPNGATLGTPQVVTQGAQGLDFTLASTTCTGTVPAGGSCTVNVTFAPLAPGLRMGAINLFDTGNILQASTLIYGVGQGPAAVIAPGQQSFVNTGTFILAQPRGVAVDAAGDIFIADNSNQRVLKVAANGTVSTVGSGLTRPNGISLDGAGNLFVAISNSTQSSVVEVPFGCTSAACQSTVGFGLSQVGGVAVDGAGNIFLNDIANNDIVKVPAGCASSACQSVVYGPIANSSPGNIAVDAAGDLFIPDSGLQAVIKVPAGCATASCQVKIGQGLQVPISAAVDAAGDVFVTDNSLAQVVEIPVSCTSSACQMNVVSGINPYGMAVDGQGNIFVSDTLFNKVIEVNRSQPPSVSFAPTNVGTTSSPISFALQNIGNQPLNAETPGLLFVNGPNFASVPGSGAPADCSGTGVLAPGAACNVSLSFMPQTPGPFTGAAVFHDNALNYIAASQTISLSGIGVSATFPLTVSLIGSGTGIVADSLQLVSCSEANGATTGTCSANYSSGSQVTLTATPTGTSTFLGWGGDCAIFGTGPACSLTIGQAANVTASFVNPSFGNIHVCPAGQTSPAPCSTSLPVTYNLATTKTVGAIKVVTQGTTGLDFSLGSGSSCTGTVNGGSSCTVNVNFAPIAPGLRMGAVQLYDNSGNLIQSTPVYGIGQEPVIAFGTAPETTVGSGLATPIGVTVDAAGDIFIGDYGNQRVVEIPAGGGNQITIASGLNFPEGVAVDGAGNVYIADSDNNRVLKVPPGGGPQTTVGSGLNIPTGVAVDGAGNVFIADYHNNRVVEVPAGGGPQTTVGSGLNVPQAVAVDGLGNVFIADSGNNQVVKVTSGGVQTTVPASGLNDPIAVAVDAAGDVFIGNYNDNNVIEVAPSGVQTIVPTSGLGGKVLGVSMDGAGNIFLADFEKSRVVKVNRSQTPSLSFATTNVGTTSSPQSISVQNVGNQPLTGSLTLSLGGNFTQTANPDCSANLPLAPGAICGESFSFTPQSATFLSGTAVFSDNNLDLVSSTQTITLSGTGSTNGVAGLATVPNVVGQVQSAVTTPITGAGLALGTVSTSSSQTVPSGMIISQNPAAGTQVAVGSAVNLLVSTGLPQPNAPNPLSLNNNYFLTGDYVSAGVTLRGTGVGGIATGSITIPNYTQSTTLGVPDGADIVDAFLYWETLENTPTASSTNGTFNNYQIVGQQIGNDIPSYVDGQFTGTIRSYRANVNLYLPVGANGVRYASGTYKVSLPDGGTALPLTEGASLVLIYRVLSPNFPLKSVVVYDGSAASTAGATQTVQGFYDAVGGASGTGKNTNIFSSGGAWNSSASSVTLGQSNQFSATLNPAAAYAAVIFSTPVNNSDNDGILDAWKAGPAAGDFHAGQPGYYDIKTGTWVGLPGAKHGQKDLFVQLDYMCGAVLTDGSCDPTKENLFPSPDASGKDPLAMVQQAFANSGVQLHLQIGNAIPEDTCVDDLTTTPATLCQFPGQTGVVGWKNSLEFSKLYPRNLLACLTGGDCTTRFPYGQKDSYHYVLMGHSLAIPAWNTRYGTLTAISVSNHVATIVTADRGAGSINACPSRITLSGVLGNPSLNGVYNTTSCADTKTITFAAPGVPDYTYPNNTLPEPVIGLTSGTISSISGYSDLGGADSAVTLGLWLTAKNQDMSKKANVVAGTIFHEIGHTLGLSHGGLYYDTPNSFVPTFEGNCKPNYQSVMNYLFQLDLVGPNNTLAFSNQTLNTLNESTAGSVTTLTDASNNPATFPTTAWYVPYTTGSTVTPATRHCDGTPLAGDSAYRVDASIAPISPSWSNGQDLNFIGKLQTQERGFNDLANMDLRQLGATGGEFASLANVLSFGSSVAPLNIGAGGNVTLGSGGTVALGSGGTVTLGSGGNVTLGSGGTVTLGSGGTVTLGSGGNVTLGSGGTITPGSSGTVTLGSGGNVTLGSGGTVTLGSGGTVTLGSGGNVTLGSGGTVTLGSGGASTVVPAGGTVTLGSGGTVTLGSGGNVTLGSGGNVTLGSGGTIALGSGGNVTLGSGGNVTLGSGGTVTLGSGGTVALGSGGNVTLGSGGTVALGSGGTVTLGSGGNVTLGSGGTVTLGSGGNVALGSGGNVTLGSGGSATLAAGGTVTLGSGGNVTLGSGGNVTLGSGGTVTLGSGGNVTLGSGGTVTLGSGGNVTLGSGGTVTLGSGGTVTLGSGGTVTLGSGGVPIPVSAGGTVTLGSGGTVTLGSGGTVTLGSGGNVTLGSGGIITQSAGGTVTLGSGGNTVLGSGGTVTLGSGGNVTLGSGGTVTLGSGGTVTLGSGGVVTLGNGGSVNLGSGSNIALGSVSNITPASGGPAAANELTYETANSVVRAPTAPIETTTPAGVRVTWNAPLFGVVQTYTIYRSSNGFTPIVIGSVSGINGNPPATEFTDTNPDVTSQTVTYTISTVLVPDTTGASPRQSVPSPPAVLKNDQSITLGPLPSSVIVSNPPTVTATALSGGVPNGLQVAFSATGACAIGSQSIASNVSSATVALTGTGSCTVTASQPGTTSFNAANSVSGTFMILPLGSSTQSQTINFPLLPNAQYGSSFSLSATSTSRLAVDFSASGPCTAAGVITGVGVCSITASVPGNSTYSAASLTQSFTIYPAVLKVTATSLTSVYGQPLPALTYAYSGFVNGETAAVVFGAPALSTTATSASTPGNYPITVSTGSLAAANYSFLYVTGTLTVQQANQTPITLHTTSPLIYGQSETLSAIGGSTGGALTYNLISGPCALTGAKLTANSGTGVCLVIATMAGSSNYNPVTSTPANAVVLTPASQTITFTMIPPTTALYKSTFTVAATGGASGNAVTFTSAGACINSGATYTMTKSTGTCSVIASQAGNLNYAAATPVTKTVSATGPLLSVTPSSINFGTLYYGSISAQTITVTNIGTAPATINDPLFAIVTGGNSNEFVAVNLCPKPLAAGKSCTMLIGFIAGPYYTPQTATLQIVSNAPGSPQPVALSALVINPQASFNPTSLNFGTIKHATTGTLNVTLSNPGGTPLLLNGIAVTGANATSFVQTNNCGTSLAAGASCSIGVKFTPPAIGTFNANLTVVDNSQTGGGTQTVPLSGKGN